MLYQSCYVYYLLTCPQKKLKKAYDIAPDLLKTVLQGDADSGDEDCITLDSDDEGIDFTDPKWMEEFFTDEDRRCLHRVYLHYVNLLGSSIYEPSQLICTNA